MFRALKHAFGEKFKKNGQFQISTQARPSDKSPDGSQSQP
jgi:hypothetical protein